VSSLGEVKEPVCCIADKRLLSGAVWSKSYGASLISPPASVILCAAGRKISHIFGAKVNAISILQVSRRVLVISACGCCNVRRGTRMRGWSGEEGVKEGRV
jgi:hypothetical protein